MVCSTRKHLKRIAAPSRWMLDKMGGNFAPKPSSGPIKSKECLPLILLIRNKLKYALTYDETKKIVKAGKIKINGKVRTDITFPLGLMDVIEIPGTKDVFRLLLDTLGRFRVIRIQDKEKNIKLVKIRKVYIGLKGIPHATTDDGRTLRFLNPKVKVNDTVIYNTSTSTVQGEIKMALGAVVMVTRGKNVGRLGKLMHIDRIQGAKDLARIKDSKGREFITLLESIIAVGDGLGSKPYAPCIKWLSEKGLSMIPMERRLRNLNKLHTKSR